MSIFKGKTLLITGGTGYIGSHTAIELLKQGKNIYELPLKVCFYARVSTLNEMQKSYK